MVLSSLLTAFGLVRTNSWNTTIYMYIRFKKFISLLANNLLCHRSRGVEPLERFDAKILSWMTYVSYSQVFPRETYTYPIGRSNGTYDSM